jgi:hypothetical protein
MDNILHRGIIFKKISFIIERKNIMRFLKKFCIAVFCLMLLTACQHKSPANMTANIPGDTIINEKEAANKVDFQEILDLKKLPSNMENSINILKANKGYLIYDYNGYYYIAVFSGMKNTGGYDIKVLSIEDDDGSVLITALETQPKEGTIVTQAVTYPYTIIKVCGITPDITVINTNGQIFEKLVKQGEMH